MGVAAYTETVWGITRCSRVEAWQDYEDRVMLEGVDDDGG